jgi:hypothetical protein
MGEHQAAVRHDAKPQPFHNRPGFLSEMLSRQIRTDVQYRRSENRANVENAWDRWEAGLGLPIRTYRIGIDNAAYPPGAMRLTTFTDDGLRALRLAGKPERLFTTEKDRE